MIKHNYAVLEMIEMQLRYVFAFLLITFAGIQLVGRFFRVVGMGVSTFCAAMLMATVISYIITKCALAISSDEA
jgi:hypothetical protein